MEVVMLDQSATGIQVSCQFSHMDSGVEDRLLCLVDRVSKVTMEAFQVKALVALQPCQKARLG